MTALDVIANRRSIRKYKEAPVPEAMIRQILEAGTLAPSGKNRQPWRFVVVRSPEKRAELVAAMREGIASLESLGIGPGSAKWSANIMEKAAVTILIFNPLRQGDGTIMDLDAGKGEDVGGAIMHTVDVQSVGAAIQNMCLAATELGLGSLWICDVFSAYGPLCEWLGTKDQLIAALALGYADEAPNARPRKPVSEVTTWM